MFYLKDTAKKERYLNKFWFSSLPEVKMDQSRIFAEK